MSSGVHCELVKNIVKRTGYLDRIISEGFKIREIKQTIEGEIKKLPSKQDLKKILQKKDYYPIMSNTTIQIQNNLKPQI